VTDGAHGSAPSGPRPRAVVSGAAGFLGSHLSERLIEHGWDVIGLDNLLTGRLDNLDALLGSEHFTFEHYDVTNFVHVAGPIDAVLHFASPASPADYLEHPIKTLKVGSLGTHNMLGLSLAKGAKFFLASTSEVYGDPQVHPQTEDYWGHVNPVGPRGVYDEAKRFAEALALAYHRSHGLDVRIVRIFNSILADEYVLFDDGSELRRERIGDLAARVGDNTELHDYRVPSFDAAGTIASLEATHLVGHAPTGPCYEIRTRYGRTLRVTGDHSVFVEGTGGCPVAKPVSQLAPGDRVAIAGRVRVPERDRRDISLSTLWDRRNLDPWSLLVRWPGLGSEVWQRRSSYFALLEREQRPGGTAVRNSIWSRIRRDRDRDQLPLAAVRALGISIPAEATVRLRTAGPASELPERISMSDELLWVLGLFVAEGCWHRSDHDAFINICCDVGRLERVTKIIERDLGLHVTWQRADVLRGRSVFVHSRPLLELLDDLGFLGEQKAIPGWVLGLPLARLKWFIEGYREGDGVHSGRKLDEGIRHEFSTVSTRLKDDLIVAFGRFGLVPSVGRHTTTLRHRTGDRRYPFWRLTISRCAPWSPLDWDGGVEQTLNARRYGDLVFAAIREIREVEPTSLVYDFCVPGTENFFAGGAVMAHNTYGPRLRPADGRVVSNLLVQAMRGDPLTVYGDGKQTRSFCYVDDEVRGLVALFESDYVGPVNIGNPNEFTILELAETVLQVTGSSSEITFEPLPVDDPMQRRPDITLARRLLGWQPEIDLREGLERTYAWYRAEFGEGGSGIAGG
jgi:nucleoside-diphosphate-sugar epimerase/intein/homing endonuclease